MNKSFESKKMILKIKTRIFFFIWVFLNVLFSTFSIFADDTLGRSGNVFILQGEIGAAEKLSIQRYKTEPFTNVPWLRADLSFEEKRIFTNYSGDISGRFLEVMAALAKGNTKYHPSIEPLIEAAVTLQRPDGHYGDPDIDWDGSVDLQESSSTGKVLPALWGNGRIFCGLIDMYQATGDPRLLQSAEKLGDFYVNICRRFTDTKRISEFTGFSEKEINEHLARCEGGELTLLPAREETHAAGYVTCFFPGMEGLTKLYIITKNKKYLETAEKMAGFYRLFDVPDTTHAHGMLCCHYAFLLLYQETGNDDYLKRVEQRWETLTSNGVVCPFGGTSEAARLHFHHDEGCALADWLRVNLKLFEITKKARYLEIAERLIHNQYLANEWSNGGFGHRHIFCDNGGIYGLGPNAAEAVWCCNYHGTMGFLNFKKYLASVDSDALTLHFALDFDASLQRASENNNRKLDFQSRVQYDPPNGKTDQKLSLPEGVVLRQSVQFQQESGSQNGYIRVRLPDWAEAVTLRTSAEHPISMVQDGQYLRSQEKISFQDVLHFDYHGGVFLENRTLQRITPKPGETGKYGQIVFRYGPKVLVARGIRSIPTIRVPDSENVFLKLAPNQLQFECSVPAKANIHKLSLTTFGYGTEKETAVFVFEATCGNLEHVLPDQIVSLSDDLAQQGTIRKIDEW